MPQAVLSDKAQVPVGGALVRFPRRPGQRVKASADQLQAILDALEIELIPPTKTRRENQITAGETLRTLLAQHGPEHLTMTLRTITESAGNQLALTDPIVRAISAVMLAHPAWPDTGSRWLEAFDAINLVELYSRAKPLKHAVAGSAWMFLAGMLVDRLHPIFTVPPVVKPTKAERDAARAQRKAEDRVRREAVQTKINAGRIEIGRQLIEMKRTAGWRSFTRAAMQRFDELRASHQPAEYMNVAKLYADRPAIWHGQRWQVLASLASPTLPAKLRREFERRIEAGERVTAPEIAARRAADPAAPKGRHPKR